MHIALDARMYHVKGGHGRYLRELIGELQRVDTKNRYTIILHPEGFSAYVPANDNFRAIATTTPWYGIGEQISFLRLLNSINADLAHFPHWNVPFFYKKPFVVTIHDLLLLSHNTAEGSTLGGAVYWIKYAGFRMILKRALTHARHIITVSETARGQILEHFPELTTKITPIHLGTPVIASGVNAASVMPSEHPYFLYVGVAYPHKNLPFLLEAFHQYGIRYGRTHKLILAGSMNRFYERLFKTDTAKTLFADNDLVYVDAPDDAALELLYKNATAVVCSALMEGFGLPALEAAARCVSVIASRIPAFVEILGDAAIYFDPTNTESLIAALCHSGASPDRSRDGAIESRTALIARAAQFSWQKTAEKTLEVYVK